LYNTTFWALVQQGGLSQREAEEKLKGTFSADKNEILFKEFRINYNDEEDMYRKGSVVVREFELVDKVDGKDGQGDGAQANREEERGRVDDGGGSVGFEEEQQQLVSKTQQEKMRKAKQKARVVVLHCDIISDEFWERRPWILSGRVGKSVKEKRREGKSKDKDGLLE